MKLLLDQGLPRTAANLLRQHGINTLHVGEIGLAAAADEEILAYGRAEERTIATLDADFHALLALSGAQSPSVIRLRLEGLKAEGLVVVLERVFDEWGEELELGAVVTVDQQRIRMRRLPLISK
jgi:predicted nuclease of predicted toxin-antitoxin system